MIVIAVLLIVTVIALPTIATAMANARLRSSAESLAGLVHKARMQAAANHSFYSLQAAQQGTATLLYLDLKQNGALASGDPVVSLEQNVSYATSGNPSTASMGLTFTPQPPTVMPAFNLDGLPCQLDSQTAPTACNHMPPSGPVGFVTFVTGQSGFGSPGWAAVSVSPSGKVRVWIWSGSTWE